MLGNDIRESTLLPVLLAFTTSFKQICTVWEDSIKKFSDQSFVPLGLIILCMDNLNILTLAFLSVQVALLMPIFISLTFSGKFAYRTHMHQFGFALPTNLASLGAVCLTVTLCADCAFRNLVTSDLFFEESLFRNWNEFLSRWYIWLWLIWFISQIWITMHLWTTENERLALAERIFSTITYDSLMIDQCLALNRRTQNENIEQDQEEENKNAQLPVKIEN